MALCTDEKGNFGVSHSQFAKVFRRVVAFNPITACFLVNGGLLGTGSLNLDETSRHALRHNQCKPKENELLLHPHICNGNCSPIASFLHC